MKDFKRIVYPCRILADYYQDDSPMIEMARVEIKYIDGNLSISSQNGQNIDEVREAKHGIAEGWTRADLDWLCDTWEEWHLNGLHPECEHQRELGWNELARKTLTSYMWTLTEHARDKKRAIEKLAMNKLCAVGSVELSPDEQAALNLESFLTTYTDTRPSADYEPVRGSGVYKHINTSIAGHTYHMGYEGACMDMHPDGLLCKPCPVCGYEYGTAWNTVEVPEHVLTRLYSIGGKTNG